jgi:hypothetical protein
MSKDQVISLLVLATLMQIIGTSTVAMNYARSASLAKLMLERLSTAEEEADLRISSPRYQLHLDSPLQAHTEAEAYGRQSRSAIREVVMQLNAKWYLTLGIVAYFLGAVLDLAAGIGALHGS